MGIMRVLVWERSGQEEKELILPEIKVVSTEDGNGSVKLDRLIAEGTVSGAGMERQLVGVSGWRKCRGPTDTGGIVDWMPFHGQPNPDLRNSLDVVLAYSLVIPLTTCRPAACVNIIPRWLEFWGGWGYRFSYISSESCSTCDWTSQVTFS